MALLFADGFEDGTASWDLITGGGVALGTGRYGNGIALTGTSGRAIYNFAGNPTTVLFGFAFKPNGTAQTPICGVMDSTNNSWCNFGLIRNTDGSLTYGYGDTGGHTPVGTPSAAGVMPANAWSYVEFKVLCHLTAGTVLVKVNGVTVLNQTGVKTARANAPVAYLRLGMWATLFGIIGNAYDDFYMVDQTGSYNNDLLGELTVEHLRPNADDGTAQWTGSDGNSTNNYDLVDEAGTFNGADYVQSSTVGQRDLYTIGASSRPTAAPVAAVLPVAVCMKTETGTRAIKLDIKEGAGGTVRQSADLGLPTSFGEMRAVFDRKNDGTAWTVNDVNNLRIGYEVSL